MAKAKKSKTAQKAKTKVKRPTTRRGAPKKKPVKRKSAAKPKPALLARGAAVTGPMLAFIPTTPRSNQLVPSVMAAWRSM